MASYPQPNPLEELFPLSGYSDSYFSISPKNAIRFFDFSSREIIQSSGLIGGAKRNSLEFL